MARPCFFAPYRIYAIDCEAVLFLLDIFDSANLALMGPLDHNHAVAGDDGEPVLQRFLGGPLLLQRLELGLAAVPALGQLGRRHVLARYGAELPFRSAIRAVGAQRAEFPVLFRSSPGVFDVAAGDMALELAMGLVVLVNLGEHPRRFIAFLPPLLLELDSELDFADFLQPLGVLGRVHGFRRHRGGRVTGVVR